jgi:hypothetical protein
MCKPEFIHGPIDFYIKTGQQLFASFTGPSILLKKSAKQPKNGYKILKYSLKRKFSAGSLKSGARYSLNFPGITLSFIPPPKAHGKGSSPKNLLVWRFSLPGNDIAKRIVKLKKSREIN